MTRIRRFLVKQILYKHGNPRVFVFRIIRNNVHFDFMAPPRIGYKAKRFGIENQICRLVVGNVDSYSQFLDIGANYGYISLMAGSHGIIVNSFEAIPFISGTFSESIRRNGLQKVVRVHQLALGAQDGGSVYVSHLGNSYPVKCRKLDSINLTKRVGLMKIDIDGEELQVLKGAIKLILRDKPIIVVELNKEKDRILNFLKGCGYTEFHWTNGQPFEDVYPPNLVASTQEIVFR